MMLEENRAFCRLEDSDNQAQNGGLARATPADDDESFLWIDSERNGVQYPFSPKLKLKSRSSTT